MCSEAFLALGIWYALSTLFSNLCEVVMLCLFKLFKGKQRDPKTRLAKFEHDWVLSGQVCQND